MNDKTGQKAQKLSNQFILVQPINEHTDEQKKDKRAVPQRLPDLDEFAREKFSRCRAYIQMRILSLD